MIFIVNSYVEVGITDAIYPIACPCDHWFIRIRNKRLHNNRYELPQLFLSGELHGNERVAPNALVELVPFLLFLHYRQYIYFRTVLILIRPIVSLYHVHEV